MEKNFGIIGIEYQFPNYYVDQKDIAKKLNVDENKLLIGLGMLEMGVASSREDPVTLAMGAVTRLLKKYNIATKDVGKIEVGSESNYDGSKSIKTHLMSLFEDNTNICGCDNINACYGGTNALFNALGWLESSLWDGRYAIVVCTDICMYKEEQAIPTSGAGAVAMLLGPDCIFKITNSVHYSANTFDFMKPKELFPFPFLNGKLSIQVYNEAFQNCYNLIKNKKGNTEFFNYLCCHAPYARLVEKIALSNEIPIEKVKESLLVPRRNANSYTASLYFSLISLLYEKQGCKVGDTILMYSFGSGCVSSMFCLEKIRDGCNMPCLVERLNQRKKISPDKYFNIINNPNSMDDDEIPTSGFYISSIEGYIRKYKKVE
ncbi:Hydroxymethylglutaryl-CoA synthase 1 [Astathelohania contejeani]|uniref:Hydroxymethylglutaryl-CoA synthase 1 n=1 Tax=Astathelohania contejeani TaxID=164912 RepID=A0ABQ7HY32_9MICR|nr:Hydroxymethylglutaryl-CoA synthase 1 [Thelohania contejeani]